MALKTKSYQYISPSTMVRDYECDLQGVVNHANYLHYMEHARHQMLRKYGESFAQKHADGYDMFVTRTELDYRVSLRSEETYVIGINLYRQGLHLIADQDVIRESDGKIVCSGKVYIAGVQDGRLTRGEYFDHLLSLLDREEK